MRKEAEGSEKLKGVRSGWETVGPSDPFQVLGEMLGEYQVLSIIAVGGTAVVYKGVHLPTQRLVAMKVFPYSRLRYEWFSREASLLKTLQHPHIVGFQDFARDRGLFFIVMEYIGGGSLRDIIQKKIPLPYGRFLEIFLEAGSALIYAHENRILHLDMKPENILFTTRGSVKLADFGTSAAVWIASTSEEFLMGTPEYMAPEQLEGKLPGPRTDVYSLSVVMYEALVGSPPFTASNPVELMVKIQESEPQKPSALPEGYPAGLSTFVLRGLRKDPLLRPSSITEWLDELLELSPSPAPAESKSVQPLMREYQQRITRREIMRAEEGKWLSSCGNLYRSSRFPYAFPPPGNPTTFTQDFISSLPLIFDSRSHRFFGVTMSNELFALSEDGKGLWKIPVGAPAGKGITLTPEGLILVPTLGGGLRFFSSDGEALQSIENGKWVAPSPLTHKNRLYFGAYDSTFYIYDYHKGHRQKTVNTHGSIVSSPCFTPDDKIIFGSLDSRLYCISTEGEILWRKKLDAPLKDCPVAGESGAVYAVTESGTFYSLNGKSGEIRWTLERQILFPPSLTYGEDFILIIKTGEMAKVSRHSGIHWFLTLPAMPVAPPIVDYMGSIWAGLDGGLLLFISFDGEIVESLKTHTPISQLLPLGPGKVLVTSRSGSAFLFIHPSREAV